MPFPYTLTPEDKAERIQAVKDEIANKAGPINKAMEEFWRIALEERVYLLSSVMRTVPFFIRYDADILRNYPYGYFESRIFNGDVRYAPYSPSFRALPDGSVDPVRKFVLTNLPDKAQMFDTAISAFRGNGGVFLKNQIISQSGASQFWQKIFTANGPYDRSYGVIAQMAVLKQQLVTLSAIPVVDFGFRCYNGSQVIYDSASVTWNQVDFFEVPANGTVVKYYPFCNGRTMIGYQTFIDPPPVDRKMLAHTINVSGGNMTVTGGNSRAHITVLVQ